MRGRNDWGRGGEDRRGDERKGTGSCGGVEKRVGLQHEHNLKRKSLSSLLCSLISFLVP